MEMPEGFIEHEGGAIPVHPEQFVETLIRTADGYGSGGVGRATYHLWEYHHHDEGIGAVVGYRLATPSELPVIHMAARCADVADLPKASDG